MSKYRTAPTATKSLPGGIPFIIGNEAAERFSFYGMKGILISFMATSLYLMNMDDPNASAMPEAKAIEWYHGFTTAVYFTPLFGALIADVFFGKYLTIMILSIVYCLGHGALALMGAVEVAAIEEMFGVDPSTFFLVLGLALIAIGSGGIKPCVSAHVGDQFGATNSHWLTQVFGWFYISINVGAALSNLLTPWLLYWYGPHWAFGVPGVLMALATFVFWLGRKRFIHVPPGGIAFLKEVFSWVGISTILKLMIIYVFVAVFWSLFDQTGSSWVLQAGNMNREWLGVTWLPAQVQLVNPVMILILVPLFMNVIYPGINKVFKLTPMRKIGIGLFVMVPGFAIVALAQSWIDQGLEPSIGWQVLAYAILTASEVMVSITCLEFSYTQAPRRMKSIIMAIFLCSVAIGNAFAMVVAAKIQISDATMLSSSAAKAVMEGDEAGDSALAIQSVLDKDFDIPIKYSIQTDSGFELAMPWPNFEGGDQIIVSYKKDGVRSGIAGKGVDVVREGAGRIETLWAEDRGDLPRTAVGEKAVAGLTDPWGDPIRYIVINRTQARVTSNGPDRLPLTSDDINDILTVNTPASPEDAQSWRQRQIAYRDNLLGIKTSEDADGKTAQGKTLEQSISIGGGQTLVGASYFWFYVFVMLGTAICFVPVVFLYRPKQYLQEEAGVATAESTSEAIGDQ